MSVDLNLVEFYSGVQTDKIIGVWEGEFETSTAPTWPDSFSSVTYTTIEHNFGQYVFTKLIWSTDKYNWQDGGASRDASFKSGLASSDNTYIYISTTLLTGPFYYKVMAFWPEEMGEAVHKIPITPTTDASSDLWFDGRRDYQKIHSFGSQIVDPGIGGETVTINHDLGYYPNCRGYVESVPGNCLPATFGGTKNPWSTIDVIDFIEMQLDITNSDLVLDFYGSTTSPAVRMWWLIYFDPAYGDE